MKREFVVMSGDMLNLCRNYNRLRTIFAKDNDYFFPSWAGGAFSNYQLTLNFRSSWARAYPDIENFYFKIYLPKQRHCSEHTIRAYRYTMDALLEFVKAEKNVELPRITFEMIDSNMLTAYLDSIEQNGCGISTRNHRLKCIRAFYDYAAKFNPTTVIYFAEIQKVPNKKTVKKIYQYPAIPNSRIF